MTPTEFLNRHIYHIRTNLPNGCVNIIANNIGSRRQDVQMVFNGLYREHLHEAFLDASILLLKINRALPHVVAEYEQHFGDAYEKALSQPAVAA